MSEEPWKREPSLLERVRQGMSVYDRSSKEIGKVKEIYLGSTAGHAEERGREAVTAADPDAQRDDSLLQNLAEALGGDEELPETVRKRLMRSGFIRIDGPGILASDRFVMQDQIADVADDRVTLRVSSDELVKE